MSQPGMRVTVDAAMRARDVSRPWDDDDDAVGRPRAADAARPAPDRAAPDRTRWPGRARSSGPDRAASTEAGTPARGDDGDQRAGGRARDDGAQRDERRGKADRRRLGKRHARARR
ncbi:MAG TPA: hypothetical protein VE465_07340 [Streptosporangiaceae bacterium]|nr:hypothetical protein [Streptosporangiaceae bacterium]